jgi:hypothetical protein
VYESSDANNRTMLFADEASTRHSRRYLTNPATIGDRYILNSDAKITKQSEPEARRALVGRLYAGDAAGHVSVGSLT